MLQYYHVCCDEFLIDLLHYLHVLHLFDHITQYLFHAFQLMRKGQNQLLLKRDDNRISLKILFNKRLSLLDAIFMANIKQVVITLCFILSNVIPGDGSKYGLSIDLP